MTKLPETHDWVYAVVQSRGDQGVFLGYRDESSALSYIPAFYNKEDAWSCFARFPRDPEGKYEVQAVLFEELARDAAGNKFLIFMLDGEGHIQHQIDPATVSAI